MSKDTHSKNMIGSSLPLKFTRTEKTQAAQTTLEKLVEYMQRTLVDWED